MPSKRFSDHFETRENNFDFLRMLFACLVIFSHSFPLTRGTNTTEPLSRLSHGTETFGSISVAGFFVISGALITQSLMRSGSLAKFVSRRATRILPGYLAASAAVLIPTAWLLGRAAFPLSIAKHMLVFDSPRSNVAWASNPFPYYLNGSIWTIKYEVVCYALVAVLGATGVLRRSTAFILLLAASILNTCEGRWHVMSERDILLIGQLNEWPKFLASFSAGMVAILCSRKIPHRMPIFIATVCGFILIIRFSSLGPATVLKPAIFAYAVFFLAFSRLPFQRFDKFGDFSYGTYLYAFPIQQTLVWRFPNIHPLALFAMALPLTLAAAVLSWHLVEKPFLNRRARATAPA